MLSLIETVAPYIAAIAFIAAITHTLTRRVAPFRGRPFPPEHYDRYKQ